MITMMMVTMMMITVMVMIIAGCSKFAPSSHGDSDGWMMMMMSLYGCRLMLAMAKIMMVMVVIMPVASALFRTLGNGKLW